MWTRLLAAWNLGNAARRPRRRGGLAPQVEPLEGRELLTSGILDPTFGDLGRTTTTFNLGGTNTDEARAVVVQKSGRYLVVGSATVNATGNTDVAIARYFPDGSLDTSFNGGKVVVPIDLGGTNEDVATCVAVQANGRVLVGGYAATANNGYDFFVIRLNKNGLLDRTFDTDGKVQIAFDRGPTGSRNDMASSLAIQSDGRIVVAGASQFNSAGDYDLAAARLRRTGALDANFDGDGKLTIVLDGGGVNDDRAVGVAIRPNNRIVIGGYSTNATGGHDFVAARVNANGTPDATFGNEGVVRVPAPAGQDQVASALLLQANGALVLAGTSTDTTTGNADFTVIRLTPSGDLDPSFSGDGRATVAFDLGGTNRDVGNAVALDREGRLVVAGEAEVGYAGDTDLAVARLARNGELDPTFNTTGQQTVAFNLGSTFRDRARGVRIDSLQRIVLAGSVEQATADDFDFGVARLT